MEGKEVSSLGGSCLGSVGLIGFCKMQKKGQLSLLFSEKDLTLETLPKNHHTPQKTHTFAKTNRKARSFPDPPKKNVLIELILKKPRHRILRAGMWILSTGGFGHLLRLLTYAVLPAGFHGARMYLSVF